MKLIENIKDGSTSFDLDHGDMIIHIFSITHETGIDKIARAKAMLEERLGKIAQIQRAIYFPSNKYHYGYELRPYNEVKAQHRALDRVKIDICKACDIVDS